jgi:hypothetical protein
MSEELVRYARSGGRPPADDERLVVFGDGGFEARRTVGGARAGTFAGRLSPARLRALADAAAACRGTVPPVLPAPRDGATESITITADEAAVVMGSDERLPQPWRALVAALRTQIDRVVDSPVAGVELVADARSGRLVPLGQGAIEVDVAAVHLRLARLDAADATLATWQHGGATADVMDPFTGSPLREPAWQPTVPGWALDLPFPPELAPGAGEWLRVVVIVPIRADGSRRVARLGVAVRGSP